MADAELPNEPMAALALPAAFVNRFYISVMGGVVRIAAMEMAPDRGQPIPRAAVVTLAEDARALAELILELLPAKNGKESA